MTEETIFVRALEKGTRAERAAFLEEVCAGDEALRRRVESLLESHEDVEFLRTPAVERAAKALGAEATVGMPEPAAIGNPTIAERPGTVIGPYRLLQEIGEGGMGSVFMAEQTEPLRRTVAMKLIKAGMDSRQVLARFEAERQALALMDHPNIARVLDAGATGSGRPYFVMELIRGTPITDYCDREKNTIRERLGLFVDVCQAVQHAHQKGIIHRDIKPSNVLVTVVDGAAVPKVIDFGVAKAMGQQLTERTLFTAFAQLVGTPLYMSPEQAALSDVDTRSDIYALGVLLYELLTGTTPFDRESFHRALWDEKRRLIREEEPPRPSTRLSASNASLPSIAARRRMEPARLTRLVRGELDWIVMKCLEKDRSRRYETAAGVAADLRRYLDDEPVLACPPSAAYRFRKFARRNKAAIAVTTCVGFAILVSVVVLAHSNIRIRQETYEKEAALNQAKASFAEAKRQEKLARDNAERAAEQTQIAQANEKTARANEELAHRRYYAAQMNLAMQAWHGGDVPRVLELLEGQRPKKNEPDLRGFEWYYLWRLCNAGRRHLQGHTDAVLSLSYSPDGKTLASAGADSTIRLWDVATGRERKLLRTHRPWDVIFSPDGRTLASGGKTAQELTLWNTTTGQPIWKVPVQVWGLAFSPDGRTLLGGGAPTRLWDVASGVQRTTSAEVGLMLGMLPDSKTVVTLANQYNIDCEIRFYDAGSGARRLAIPVPRSPNAALSRDGTRVASAVWGVVKLWETATGTLAATFPTTSVRTVAISPDGKRLAAGHEDRRVVVWNIESGEPLGQDVHRDVVWAFAFAPDGKTIASATLGGDIKLWDMTSPAEADTIPIGGVTALRFSQDSRTLFVGHSGPTSLIDVATGKEVALLPFSDVRAVSANHETAARLEGESLAEFWSMSQGRQIADVALPVVNHGEAGITLSADGKQAVSFVIRYGGGTVRLWDIATRQARSLEMDPVPTSAYCAAFSPDGTLMAAGFQFQWVGVWDVATGVLKQKFFQMPTMMTVTTLTFSPDGRALAIGTDIGAVTLWDVQTGRQLAAFKGHTSRVNGLTFSPDGQVLATAGTDKTVRLWDARTGQERSTLIGHSQPVHHVLFSPDGNTLATAAWDGTVRLWRTATDSLARAPGSARSPGATAASPALPPGAIELSETGLREAVRRCPETVDFRRRLASLLRDQGRPDEAEALLTEIARQLPDRDEAYIELAAALSRQKKFAEAETALREAIRLKPGRPGTHETLGWLFAEQHQFARAEAAFREAIRLKPDLASAHYGLGKVLREQKKFAEAVAPLREALRLDPARVQSYGQLGWVFLQQQLPAEAEAEFRKLIRLRPDVADAYFGLGNALRLQKKPAEALTALREAVRRDANHYHAHDLLGWSLVEQGRFAEAEAEFRETIRLKAASAGGHFGLGRTLVEQKKFAEAEAALREALRLEPDHPWARQLLGRALTGQGKRAEAEALLTEKARPEPP